jgi:AcrR family transcriptional regulator
MQSETNRFDDILEVAEALFRAKGYKATSMNDVAEACCIHKASLYYHFAGKEQLALAVMTSVQEHFDSSIFNYAYDQRITCDVRLLQMNKAVESFFSVKDCGCLFSNFAIEQMELAPAFVKPIRRYFDSWSNAYSAIFSCVYKVNVARSLASDFASDLQGALIMMRVTGDKKPMLRLSERLTKALTVGLRHQKGSRQAAQLETAEGPSNSKREARLTSR